MQTEAPNKPGDVAKGISAIITLVIMGLLVWYYFFGGVEKSVANNFVKNYEIAKRNGNTLDAATQAGIAAAAFLDAKDETNYLKWKKIADDEFASVGVKR